MRELFEASQADNPVEAVRRAVRPVRRRRFYKTVTIAAGENGHAVLLDGKPARTPAGPALAAPVPELARALAQDCAAPGEPVHVAHPAAALEAAAAAIPDDAILEDAILEDNWRLVALHVATTLTGSALLALALMRGFISAEAAWAAAHVDEDWNMEQWGRDEIALQRRAFRFAEFQAAANVMAVLA